VRLVFSEFTVTFSILFLVFFSSLGGAGLGLILHLLQPVLWLGPGAWGTHVLGLGHHATITEDAIVTDPHPSLVHGLGPMVSSFRSDLYAGVLKMKCM
jgi:hypothetical protein